MELTPTLILNLAPVSFSKGHVIACHLLTPQSFRPQCGQSDLQGGQCRCCG
jgi:hypothetical protein